MTAIHEHDRRRIAVAAHVRPGGRGTERGCAARAALLLSRHKYLEFAAAAECPKSLLANRGLPASLSHADLTYARPVDRSEEGMPVGNGRAWAAWCGPRRRPESSSSIGPSLRGRVQYAFLPRAGWTTRAAAVWWMSGWWILAMMCLPPASGSTLSVYDGSMTAAATA